MVLILQICKSVQQAKSTLNCFLFRFKLSYLDFVCLQFFGKIMLSNRKDTAFYSNQFEFRIKYCCRFKLQKLISRLGVVSESVECYRLENG